MDVFAERPYTGNQLAVVHGADGLDDAQLLAIAREFNYSLGAADVVQHCGVGEVRVPPG